MEPASRRRARKPGHYSGTVSRCRVRSRHDIKLPKQLGEQPEGISGCLACRGSVGILGGSMTDGVGCDGVAHAEISSSALAAHGSIQVFLGILGHLVYRRLPARFLNPGHPLGVAGSAGYLGLLLGQIPLEAGNLGRGHGKPHQRTACGRHCPVSQAGGDHDVPRRQVSRAIPRRSVSPGNSISTPAIRALFQRGS